MKVVLKPFKLDAKDVGGVLYHEYWYTAGNLEGHVYAMSISSAKKQAIKEIKERVEQKQRSDKFYCHPPLEFELEIKELFYR